MMDSKILLPTDNLYKFMFLAGVILVFLTFILLSNFRDKKIEIIELSGEIDRLEIESEYLLEDMTELMDETDRLKGERIKSESNVSDKDKKRISESLEFIEKGHAEITQKLKLLEEQRRELRRERQMLRENIKTKNWVLSFKSMLLTHYFAMIIASPVAGAFLAICGFHQWYNKLQKYQDRIVKNQAEKEQQEKNPQKGNSREINRSRQ